MEVMKTLEFGISTDGQTGEDILTVDSLFRK